MSDTGSADPISPVPFQVAAGCSKPVENSAARQECQTAPCALRAPGKDVRPGVVVRAENPVGSSRRLSSASTGVMFNTVGRDGKETA
jgi:hypothetical protein